MRAVDLLGFIVTWSITGSFFLTPVIGIWLLILLAGSVRQGHRSLLPWRFVALVLWSVAAYAYWFVLMRGRGISDWHLLSHPLFLLFSIVTVVFSHVVRPTQTRSNASSKWKFRVPVIRLTGRQWFAFVALAALGAYGLWGVLSPWLPPSIGGMDSRVDHVTAQELAYFYWERTRWRYYLMAGIGVVGGALVLLRAHGNEGTGRDHES